MRPNRPRSLKRQLSLALAVGAVVTAVLPGAVSAAAPIGGCPTGAAWYQITPVHQPQAADKNGDGRLCRLDLHNGTFTFFDNVVRGD